MTTRTFASQVEHTSDATFRAWSKELHDEMIAAGLVQTSDTGQINFTTVTRPGNSAVGGYTIYRFNDSLQSTAPIFLKIEWATASTNQPTIWLTVGTGSNGSGTLTGVTSDRRVCFVNAVPVSYANTYVSYVCVTAGALAVAWKLGAAGTGKGMGYFSVIRSTDDTGAPTGAWAAITRSYGATSYYECQVINFTNLTTYPSSLDGSHSNVPQNVSSSLVGADVQVFKHYVCAPRVSPLFAQVTVLTSEVGQSTSFSVIPIGSTISRTYISLGPNGNYAAIGGTVNSTLAMIWE